MNPYTHTHTHTYTHIYTFLNCGTAFCLPLYQQVENFRNVYIFLQISTHQTTNIFEDMRIFFMLIFAQNLFTLFFAPLYLFNLRSIHKRLLKWTSTLIVLCWDSFLFKIKVFYTNYSNLGATPHGMWDPSSSIRHQAHAPCSWRGITLTNHWTTREVPEIVS